MNPIEQQSPPGRWGIVLVNLGTPDAPTTPAVRRYLREFLSDTRVIEIPKPVWWVILNLFVLPFRPSKSAHAYQSIWTDEGSPLMVLSQRITERVREALAERRSDLPLVALAMRYGRPAIAEVLGQLAQQGCDRLLVLPLYPQYSAASSGAVFDAVAAALTRTRRVPELRFIADYHAHPAYIEAVVQRTQRFWREAGTGRFLLFSFHGLPERSRQLGDPYYDQCQRGARAIAAGLGLADDAWQVVFQSRFGPAKWLQPYCVEVLAQLPGRGIQEVDVICPGFSVDCLETLEEIAIANREVFMAAGGSEYRMIPALNDSDEQLALMLALIRENLPPS